LKKGGKVKTAKLITIVALALLPLAVMAGDGDGKVRGYHDIREWRTGGYMNVGFCTWSDHEMDWQPAAYFTVSVARVGNVKLDAGLEATVYDSDFEIKMITGLAYQVMPSMEVGAYLAPFWGLADKSLADHPSWGLMVGYSW
jgi:hypothetical protein